jgi:hypothetical protein
MRGAFIAALLNSAAALAMSGCLPSSDDLGEYSSRWGESPDSPAQMVLPSQGGSGGSPAELTGSSAPSGASGASSNSEGPGASVPLVPTTNVDPSLAGSATGGSTSSPANPAPEPQPSGGSAAEQCGDGVLDGAQTSCYLVATVPATWQGARGECLSWGGDLVKVESSAEDQLLAQLVTQDLWLGASDTALENVFIWNDGSSIGFGNWGPAQPDRFPGPDCVQKRGSEGRLWFDQPCDNSWLFVCEKAIR